MKHKQSTIPQEEEFTNLNSKSAHPKLNQIYSHQNGFCWHQETVMLKSPNWGLQETRNRMQPMTYSADIKQLDDIDIGFEL